MRRGVSVALLAAVCLSPLALSCRKTDPAAAELRARAWDIAARTQAIADYVSSLPDDQRISQLFLVNVEGDTAFVPVEKTGALSGNPDDGDALVPGGCLLFSYNIADTPETIGAYTASIRQFYADHGIVPPYIAIDQEGGYVNRLRGVTSNLVSQKKVTEWFTADQAHALYAAQARQLRALGIQMNLAPVVEVETAENAAFLDTRSFGSLAQVLAYAGAEIAAYEENGVAVVLKHFPGNSNVDPHTGLPQIALAAADVATYLAPFTELAPFASAVLMSHAVVQVTDSAGKTLSDPAIPACFSSYWVRSLAQSGFDGLIFSDDIFMGALADNGYPPEIAVVSAINAGVNCIMLSEKQFGAVAGVLLAAAKENTDLAQRITASVCRVIAYKIQAGLLQYVPVAGEDGSFDEANPAYTVVPNPDFPAFDADAFKAAYAEGMSFYR